MHSRSRFEGAYSGKQPLRSRRNTELGKVRSWQHSCAGTPFPHLFTARSNFDYQYALSELDCLIPGRLLRTDFDQKPEIDPRLAVPFLPRLPIFDSSTFARPRAGLFEIERSWIPHTLRPDYTWPRPMQATVMTETPPTPSVSGPRIRRPWGHFRRLLARLSKLYCSRFNIPFTPPIMELPFRLILKWGERVRIEEAAAMQMARAAGMPVPKVLCYGENPNDSFQPISILMTQLPGWPLVILNDSFSADDEESWLAPLGKCLDSMRKWESPFGVEQICSAIGTSISSQRVPRHTMGTFKSEKELHAYLLAPASSNGFASLDEYRRSLSEARKITDMPHRIVFTHGDLKPITFLSTKTIAYQGSWIGRVPGGTPSTGNLRLPSDLSEDLGGIKQCRHWVVASMWPNLSAIAY